MSPTKLAKYDSSSKASVACCTLYLTGAFAGSTRVFLFDARLPFGIVIGLEIPEGVSQAQEGEITQQAFVCSSYQLYYSYVRHRARTKNIKTPLES